MSFQDIKGHDNITRFFKRELELKRQASAYLLFGPDATGKTLLATTLSKAMNCLEKDNDSCDKCIPCTKIDRRNHPDLVIIENKEGKDLIGIAAIRDLQKKISLKPYEGRMKVFIIQDSHTMTEEAQNCLLKTLEEPPQNSVIILITSKIEGLLLTVRSRCKQIKFGSLDLKLRVELAERQGFLKEDALFLSRLANSGIPFSVSSEEKEENRGLIDYKNTILDEFNTGKTLFDERSSIFSGSKEKMKFVISIIESWFRDIAVLKSTKDASLVINFDRTDELGKMQAKLSYEELEEILNQIKTAQFYIERNVGPKLAFNVLKMKTKELTGAKETI
ncbi:MAG: DNA polymerase III subunit [Candidatus Omnitrophica bacterium]|nr:DNA polymerase III subunit [Candidatus Omnitrophota bacterium]